MVLVAEDEKVRPRSRRASWLIKVARSLSTRFADELQQVARLGGTGTLSHKLLRRLQDGQF